MRGRKVLAVVDMRHADRLFGVRPIHARVSGQLPLRGDALSGQTSRRCTTMRAWVRAMTGHAACAA